MKKKFALRLILIGIIILIILTFTLHCVFKDQTENFGISCGLACISIVLLFAYKNALTPSRTGIGVPIDMTKKYYERKGELYKYQGLCKILFIITISVAVLTLIREVSDIFLTYIMSVFQS